MDSNDNDLNQLFGEIRERDVQSLPALDRIATRAATACPRSVERIRTRFAWHMAIGSASTCVAAALVIWQLHTRGNRLDLQQLTAMSRWQASTDVLLDISSPFLPGNTSSARTDFLLTIYPISNSNTTDTQ